MSELKHTPGPWERKNYMIYGGNRPVASIYGSSFLGEPEANARLIAAAPDMLAALELAHQTYENITTKEFSEGADMWARAAIAAVIAKAKGLQPGVE